MGLFDKLFNKEEVIELPALNVSDDDIVAMADGELIDVHTVSDEVFATEAMGKSIAFQYNQDKVVICAPVNGTLSVAFPTGHAFGLEANNGVEILVHIGINTVSANGEGFKTFKKQGDVVKAGDALVEVDVNKLSKTYDMATMLIITNPNGKEINFIEPQKVNRGDSVIK